MKIKELRTLLKVSFLSCVLKMLTVYLLIFAKKFSFLPSFFITKEIFFFLLPFSKEFISTVPKSLRCIYEILSGKEKVDRFN